MASDEVHHLKVELDATFKALARFP